MTAIQCECVIETDFELKQCHYFLVGIESNGWYDFATTIKNKSLYVFITKDNAENFLKSSFLSSQGFRVFPVSFAYIQRLIERNKISYIFVSPPFSFI
jgi:hypothetical protein